MIGDAFALRPWEASGEAASRQTEDECGPQAPLATRETSGDVARNYTNPGPTSLPRMPVAMMLPKRG